MIEQYRLDVLEFYKQKKSLGKLSGNLMHPTCANLRNECLNNFKYRCTKIEERMLKEFLGKEWNDEMDEKLLRKCDPDKFKPLVNFLKNNNKTHEKNIELLAWLIDFRPRPYSHYWRTSSGELTGHTELSLLDETTAQKNEVELVLRSVLESLFPEIALSTRTYEKPSKPNHFTKWLGSFIEKIKYPDLPTKVITAQREVKLEYPSGVKLYVDAADISLIEQLVRL